RHTRSKRDWSSDVCSSDLIASTVSYRSTDGGKSWVALRGAPGGDDYQRPWINPTNPKIIALASDQGAIVSVNGGETWSSWYNQRSEERRVGKEWRSRWWRE